MSPAPAPKADAARVAEAKGLISAVLQGKRDAGVDGAV